jgi:hypothetical protein
MTAMVAVATAVVVMAARVILGFLPVSGYAGACLFAWSDLPPTSQSQQQYCRKSEYQMFHLTLVVFLSQSTGLTLSNGKSFAIGYCTGLVRFLA